MQPVDGSGAADQCLAAGLGDLVRAFGPVGGVGDAVPVLARARWREGEVDVAGPSVVADVDRAVRVAEFGAVVAPGEGVVVGVSPDTARPLPPVALSPAQAAC